MSQQELLKKVVHVLDTIGIQYMISGSIASSLQGEPRTTHDADIVIDLQKGEISELLKAFPQPDYYLDEKMIHDVINKHGMFNLLEVKSGDKVDFWILTNEPFDRSRFSRRIQEDFEEIKLKVSSPEDTILMKLKWAEISGGSEKQFTDALRVYEVQYGKLDLGYIEEWAKKLKIESLWKRLIAEAEKL